MNKVLWGLFLAFLMSTSCSKVTYWSDHTAEIDFGDYQTYMIDEQCSDYNPGINPIHQQRIKNAIEIAFRDMGYIRSKDADINVKFFVKNETKYFYDNCIPEYENIEGGGQCIDKVYTYEEGTLVIDLIDIRKNKAIWHGGARGESWDNLDNADQKISEMVRVIMKEYETLVNSEAYAISYD